MGRLEISFGDQSTPLHKAVAGGRYLAVHMIVEALKERDQISEPKPENSSVSKSSWLQRGLLAKDRYGRTPIEVAHHFFKVQNTERDAVARWDVVAGGIADWEKCMQLLDNATMISSCESRRTETRIAEKQAGSAANFSNNHQINNGKIRAISRLPLHLTKGVMACLDCNPVSGENNNICLTTSWQAMFQKSLSDSASLCIIANNVRQVGDTNFDMTKTAKSTISCRNTTGNVRQVGATNFDMTKTGKSTISCRNTTGSSVAANRSNVEGEILHEEKDITVRSTCKRCQKPTVALYQLPEIGILVCKSCKRLAR